MAGTVVALAGGVGGARLAVGLMDVLGEDLAVVVNTGDDFEHLGLMICPDLDTVMYTLAGINNPETGWGLAGETWEALKALGRLGGETWFRLGDRDLGTHLFRTDQLARGQRLTEVTAGMCSALGVRAQVLPMCDSPVRTMVHTAEGVLGFQDYFVRRRCEPVVTGFEFVGAERAVASPEVRGVFGQDVRAIVICPSNPFVSVGPMRAVAEIELLLQARRCPLVAVSPIVGGGAIKGPAGKMMAELGLEVSPLGVARFYAGLVDGLVIDGQDAQYAGAIEDLGMAVLVTETVMADRAGSGRLADEVLGWVEGMVHHGGTEVKEGG